MTPEPGFERLPPLDPVMVALGPIYQRQEAGHLALAFRVEEHNCNPRGACHGGVIATFIDFHLGLNVSRWTGLGGPTLSLSIDYTAPMPKGAWVEADAELIGWTGRTAFAQCRVRANKVIAARGSGVFRPKVSPALPLSPDRWDAPGRPSGF